MSLGSLEMQFVHALGKGGRAPGQRLRDGVCAQAERCSDPVHSVYWCSSVSPIFSIQLTIQVWKPKRTTGFRLRGGRFFRVQRADESLLIYG